MKKIYATITSKSSKGSTKSINELIKALEDYKKTLDDKVTKFINELLDVGIATAQANTGKYDGYIQFTKKIEDSEVGILIGTDTELPVTWKTSHGDVGYNVRPLLLAEFGSGWLANVMQYDEPISGVGQGTMPNAKGHATSAFGWWWVDKQGEHHSYGERPTYPMYYAVIAMKLEIDRIAKKVFTNG